MPGQGYRRVHGDEEGLGDEDQDPARDGRPSGATAVVEGVAPRRAPCCPLALRGDVCLFRGYCRLCRQHFILGRWVRPLRYIRAGHGEPLLLRLGHLGRDRCRRRLLPVRILRSAAADASAATSDTSDATDTHALGSDRGGRAQQQPPDDGCDLPGSRARRAGAVVRFGRPRVQLRVVQF